jgi:hypothetical protein
MADQKTLEQQTDTNDPELRMTLAEDQVTDLANLGDVQGTMTRPTELDPEDRTGTEEIDASELRLPRLSIAQGLSPQITPGDSQFIEGLTLFEMFNDMTGEIYGRGPIMFVPIRREIRRIQFRPRKEGGGIIDLNVPPNDPRLEWTEDGNGNRLPPLATTFTEFVVLLLRPGVAPEPIVLSIKHTNKWNRRAADQLTLFIAARNAPIYSGLYLVDTKVPAKNDNGTFGVPVCKNAGFIPLNKPAGAALFEYAKDLHQTLSGKTIIIDREPGSDDEDTFPGDADPARSGQASEM